MNRFDIVVIGAGIAGMTTANRAAQLGLSICVLEKGDAQKYFCNTRFSGGTFHLCRQDIMSEPGALTDYLTAETNSMAEPAMIGAIVEGAPKIISWLREEGGRFMKASGSAYHNWVLAPPGRTRTGLDWEGRAGDVLLMTLEKNLAKRGGEVRRGMRARSLVMQDGRVAGVEADGPCGRETFEARAVVIADGGFQGAPDLVAEHITAHPERLRQRGAGTGIGDGLRMAREVGAAVSDLSRFCGHLLSIDALTNDSLWPYPYLDSVVAASIVVGPDGRRFADEGRGGPTPTCRRRAGRFTLPTTSTPSPRRSGSMPTRFALRSSSTAPPCVKAEATGLPLSGQARRPADRHAAVPGGPALRRPHLHDGRNADRL
jgi:fumarate reductase flavoprotein subunit